MKIRPRYRLTRKRSDTDVVWCSVDTEMNEDDAPADAEDNDAEGNDAHHQPGSQQTRDAAAGDAEDNDAAAGDAEGNDAHPFAHQPTDMMRTRDAAAEDAEDNDAAAEDAEGRGDAEAEVRTQVHVPTLPIVEEPLSVRVRSWRWKPGTLRRIQSGSYDTATP